MMYVVVAYLVAVATSFPALVGLLKAPRGSRRQSWVRVGYASRYDRTIGPYN